MNYIDVFFLSFIQGFSEFLPVSSSAHLFLSQYFFNIKESSLEFDVALHFGSIIAVIIYFRKDFTLLVKETLNAIFKPKQKTKLFWQLFIATLPVVVFGLIIMVFNLDNYIRIIPVIAFNLIFFGIVLYVVDKYCDTKINIYSLNKKQSLFIGMFQAIALIPGVSRSGITITASRLMNVDKISSIKFAMLMSIPTILGASLLSFVSMVQKETPINYSLFSLGIFLSFIFGLIVIHFLLEFIRRFSFKTFMIYRIILGILLLVYYFNL